MKSQRGFSAVVIVVVVAIFLLVGATAWTVWQHKRVPRPQSQPNASSNSNPKLPKLIDKTYCSDLCPQNTSTYRIYKGIDNKDDCAKIGGKDIIDPAWGGYIGCGPT